MFCSNCGKDAGESNFCMHCGHKIGDVSSVNSVESSNDFFDKILFIKGNVSDKQELAELRFNALSKVIYIVAIINILIGLYFLGTTSKYATDEISTSKEIIAGGAMLLISGFIFIKLRQVISIIVILAIYLITGFVSMYANGEYDMNSTAFIIIYVALIPLLIRTNNDLVKSDKKVMIYIANGVLALFVLLEAIGTYSILSNL